MSTVNEYKRLQRNPILSRNQNICKTKPNLCLFAFLPLLGCACARERGRERQKEGMEEREEGRVVYVERVTSSGCWEQRHAAHLATPTHLDYYFKFEVEWWIQ